MPEKLVTMDATPNYASYVGAAGVSSKNIADALGAGDIAEIEAFAAVRAPVGVAEYGIGVLSADLERHLFLLRQNIRIRTAEGAAELALSALEGIIGELLVARYGLLGVLGSGTEPQREAP